MCVPTEPTLGIFPLLKCDILKIAILSDRSCLCTAGIIIAAMTTLYLGRAYLKFSFAFPAIVCIWSKIHSKGFTVNSIVCKSVQSNHLHSLGGGRTNSPAAVLIIWLLGYRRQRLRGSTYPSYRRAPFLPFPRSLDQFPAYRHSQ